MTPFGAEMLHEDTSPADPVGGVFRAPHRPHTNKA